jgi:hypothetical protein
LDDRQARRKEFGGHSVAPSPLGPVVRSLCDLNGLRHTGDRGAI